MFCFSCNNNYSERKQDNSFLIASWNVQNLFDNVNDGTEYSEYTRSGGWNAEAYKGRLSTVSNVLNSGVLSDAQIIVLNEIENEKVILDIMDLFKKRNFNWYAVTKEEGGAISIGIISSIPFKEATIHSVEGTRPVISVHFILNSNNVFVLAVHGKSNLGEEEKNIEMRSLLGKAVEDVVCNIKTSYPDSLIILAGDFNENPWDKNVVRNFLSWRCFWEDYGQNYGTFGSYFYHNSWYCYDNILLSTDLIESYGVITDGIVTTIDGKPNRWNRQTMEGVSDHLPVWVKVKLR